MIYRSHTCDDPLNCTMTTVFAKKREAENEIANLPITQSLYRLSRTTNYRQQLPEFIILISGTAKFTIFQDHT